MANSLRRKDAKQLKAAHEALLEDLRSAAGLATECKARAKEAAEMMIEIRVQFLVALGKGIFAHFCGRLRSA